MEKGILDRIADQNGVYISDLRIHRLEAGCCWPQLQELFVEGGFSLSEWNESLSYLLGEPVSFETLSEIKNFLEHLS